MIEDKLNDHKISGKFNLRKAFAHQDYFNKDVVAPWAVAIPARIY